MRDHPRQEPGAVIPPAGIRAGGGGQPPSLPRRAILAHTRAPAQNELPRPRGAWDALIWQREDLMAGIRG
jgi:hypothetical protein